MFFFLSTLNYYLDFIMQRARDLLDFIELNVEADLIIRKIVLKFFLNYS